MSYADVVDRAWRKNHLLVVLMELTYDCNYDCVFCYNDRGLAGERLSFDEHVKILDELAAMGVLNVVLSGGEPMVHPRFFDIGAAAKARGFVVRIKTNGHLLRGDALTRVITDIDPFVVEVSLHGATAATHDRQTRVPGSFERLLDNLTAAKQAGLRLRINSTLTSYNEHELDGMFALANRLGLPLTVDPDVTPRDDGDQSPLALTASDDALRALWRREMGATTPTSTTSTMATSTAPSQASVHHEACASESDKHCGAGSSTLCIDPVGNVYPCVQWRRAVGNVRDGSLALLWQSAPKLEEVRRLTVDVKRMVQASDGGAFMGFCPGTADSRGGSVVAPYDSARRRADAALVVKGKLRVIA